MKKTSASEAQHFEQIPNIGKAAAGDFRVLGFDHPQQLRGQDPYALYQELCIKTNAIHDPCVIDTLISAVRFMEGAPALPWWHYTPERKEFLKRHPLAWEKPQIKKEVHGK